MRRPKEQVGVADAAEYLYAIHDEFKPADEAAGNLIREAKTLLDVSVRLVFAALERNAIVLKAAQARKQGRR